MRALALMFTLGAASTASAAPALELGLDGDRLAVIARGADGPGMPQAHGDAIEVGLRSVAEPAQVDSTDATVKRMTLIGGSRPRLVIALHHGKRTTERLAALARIEMIDGTLRVTMPRDADAAQPAPPPIVTAATTPAPAAIAATEPAPTVTAPAAKAAPPHPEDDYSEARPIAAATAAPEHVPARLPWLAGAALLAIPLILVARRKKREAAIAPSLRVLASQSLGGRSRLVLVEAEGRRILLAVNDANTRVVTQYGAEEEAVVAVEDDANENLPAHAALDAYAAADDAGSDEDDGDDAPDIVITPSQRTTSPAVSGLIKLREGDTTGPSEWGEALRRASRGVRS